MCGKLQLYILLRLTHFPEVCLFQGVPLSLDQAAPGAFLFFLVVVVCGSILGKMANLLCHDNKSHDLSALSQPVVWHHRAVTCLSLLAQHGLHRFALCMFSA